MKKLRKKIAIVTLFCMMGNFFIAPIVNVYAESSSATKNYISSIFDKSSLVDSKILASKNSFLYIDESSYKYAVDNFYEEYNSFNNNYKNYINNFGGSISVRQVLVDSNSPLVSLYDAKVGRDVIVSFENIDDVTYYDSETKQDVVFMTGSDLALLINNTYFLEYYNKYNDFNINYESYINSYKTSYDNIIDDYNDAKNVINNYTLEINQFILDEEARGNKPNTMYDGVNVISKMNSYITSLDVALDRVLSSSYNNDFDSIVNSASLVRDGFFDNNKNITSELILELNTLKDTYKNKYDGLKALFESSSMDFSSIDYSLVSNLDGVKITEFITLFEEIHILDSEYQTLNMKVNDYLDRMPSESTLFESVFGDLNSYYSSLSKEVISNIYHNFVCNANLSSEDVVDSLLNYNNLTSEEHHYLMNAKEAFYTVKLINDSNYKIDVIDNYLLVSGFSNIEKSLFSQNIDYNGLNFELVGSSNILDKNTVLKLYDREGKYLKSLQIVIKNDVNGDGIVDNKDVKLLKNKVLQQNYTEYDKLASDINNDGKLNINDVVQLNKTLNNIMDNKGEKASFRVVTSEDDKYVTYSIYLKSDGIVNGFEFNVLTSSNLKFVNLTSGEGVSYLNCDGSLRVVGLGTYNDGFLALKVTFEKNLNSNEDISFFIENGIIAFDNLNYNDSISYKDIIKYQDNSEPAEVVNLSNNVSDEASVSNDSDQGITLDKALDDNVKKSEISDKKLDESDIIWGNVIKIAIIVLLGALIIYLLNKDTETNFSEEDTMKNNLDDKDTSKRVKEKDNDKENNNKKNNDKENNNKKDKTRKDERK